MNGMSVKSVQRLREAGVLVTLPGDLPLSRTTMVADALLAAPVPAVEVTHAGEAGLRLLADLRQRAGDLLLLGMCQVETAVQVAQAAAAGAEFVSSSRLDPAVQGAAQQHQLGYIPSAISVWAAQAALEQGCALVRLRTGGPQGSAFLQAVRDVLPEMPFLLEVIDLQLDDVAAYAGPGVVGMVAGTAVYTDDMQPMADIISRARAVQNAWRAATIGGDHTLRPPHANGNGTA